MRTCTNALIGCRACAARSGRWATAPKASRAAARGLSQVLAQCAAVGGTLLFGAGAAVGETATNAAPAVVVETKTNGWAFSVSVYGYVVPESQDYVQPTVTADHGWLHLEARYNYEDLETGSTWLGYNLGGGHALAWELTPMIGGVFGNTTGIAPGYKGSLTWWKLELYSEGEYVVDPGNSSGSFLYNWSELTLSPVEWFRFGMVTQRTRAYQSDRDVQRGVLAGFKYKQVSFTTYVLNPDESRPTVVLAVGVNF
jgi:hypothetical protein